MTVIKAAIIPPKMAGVMPQPCMAGMMPLSCMAVPYVAVGTSGDLAGVVGQVAGDCLTTTPVLKNKLSLCYQYR